MTLPNRCFAVVLLATLPLTACHKPMDPGSSGAPAKDSVRQPTEAAYGPADRQKLDIYLPPRRGDRLRPALLHIHGGAWVTGDKRDLVRPSWLLSDAGMVVFTLNYRLVRGTKNRWPTCYNDVRMALDWVLKRAETYRVDPDRIGVIGYSAGGHLAALLGTRAETRKHIRCVVDMFGPADLRPGQEGSRGSSLLVGSRLFTDDERYDDASPVVQVTAESPPFLILHGADDKLVPVVQSRRLYRALTDVGVPAELKVYPGAKHGFVRVKQGEANPAAADAWKRSVAFLKRHLVLH